MALIGVLLFAFQFIIISSLQTHHINRRGNEIKLEAFAIANYVAGWYGFDNLEEAGPRAVLSDSMIRRSNALGLRILVINDSASVIADSNTPSRAGQTLISAEVLNAIAGNDTASSMPESQTLHVAVSAIDTVSGRTGAVLLIASTVDIFESLADIQGTLMLTTLLVGILGVVLIFLVSHYLIAPLKRTVTAVTRMTTGQLSLRIPVKGKDEYAILATAFNDMTQKLDEVEKSREEFVSNVSHEMRTPLSAIKVLSESILQTEEAPIAMYREFMEDINGEVDRMADITRDLLALVKVDQRERELNTAPVDLTLLTENILKRLAPLADRKNIALLYEVERDITLSADEIKLSLAISNIVENGIKYTPKGGTVKVTIDADYQYAKIIIQDTGIGIPEDEQDKIFNRFYRVDKTRDRETGGTGLGLAISRSTVMLHGGRIRLTSKLDEGSVFTIWLPLGR